ncbi:MAG: hypothetical protein JWM68_150 [Verrucomicrobiales bacterium]|nr:hypothetical protein [Verrucomicrobiales bacterium]
MKRSCVVFVHGIFGDGHGTWTAKNGAYFPKLVAENPTFTDCDIYIYEYSSPYFGNRQLSIVELEEDFRLHLSSDNVLAHEEIIFVCHSMGGLIGLRFLTDQPSVADKTRFIALYATPCIGSDVPNFTRWIAAHNKNLDSMLPLREGNDFLRGICVSWKTANAQRKRPVPAYSAYEKLDTDGIRVVTEESATYLSGNEVALAITANHTEVCKPLNKGDVRFIFLQDKMSKTALRPEFTYAGRLVSSQQIPIAHAGVQIGYPLSKTLITDPNGTFSFVLQENIPNVKFTAICEGYAPLRGTIDPTGDNETKIFELAVPENTNSTRRVVKITVEFTTTDDDKDDDTRVQVTLTDRKNSVVLVAPLPNQKFEDHSTHRFDFPVSATPTLESLNGGQFRINIAPNGHDTWRFICRVVVYTDDNQQLVWGWSASQLSERQKDTVFVVP